MDYKNKNKLKKRRYTFCGIVAVLIISTFVGAKFLYNKNKAKVQASKTLEKSEMLNEQSKKEKQESLKEDKEHKEDKIDKKDNNSNATGFVENSAMTIDKVWTRDGEKIAFLTFDDGPSKNTPEILDILKKNNIKATFFIVGSSIKNYPEYLKEEVKEGHAIGNHTYSHNIKYFGSHTPQNFVNDVKKCDKELKSVLGEDFKTNLVRFPGGSFGHKSYKEALRNAGYKEIDWNMENGDATRLNVPVDELINNVKDGIKNHQHLVILMHDSSTKKTTVEALPEIIKYLRSQGFKFGIISQKQ